MSEACGVDEVGGRFVVERGSDDERGAFSLDDGIDVVNDERVGDRAVEGVRGSDQDVECGGLEWDGAGACESVDQVESAMLLAIECLGVQEKF